MKALSVLLMISLMASGCASMFHGTKDTILVRSDEADTTFYANTAEIGHGTSAVVSIPKKELAKTFLRAEKPGCTAKSASIDTKFDALSLLGILIDWGLISILVVDWAATGAVSKASRTEYSVTPECAKQQPAEQPVPQAQAQPI